MDLLRDVYLLGTFVALNFFVGVIVNNLQSVTLEERDDLADIRQALARLEARLQTVDDEQLANHRIIDTQTIKGAP